MIAMPLAKPLTRAMPKLTCRWVAMTAGLLCGYSSGVVANPPGTGEPPRALDVRRLAVEETVAGDWPAWRGPTGQGLAADDSAGYVDRWSVTDNVLWRVAVPGVGNSSPIVVGQRLWITTSYDDGRRRELVCLSTRDGQRLWSVSVTVAKPEKTGFKNNHASSTPACDGQRVVAYLGSGGVLACDVQGRRLWHTDLGAVATRHGPAGSPVLYGGRVYLYQDQGGSQGSSVVCVNASDGRILWRTPRAAKVGWGSPALIELGDGRRELIVSGQDQVTAYDAANGSVLWYCQGNTEEVTPTPVVGGGLVYCCSGRAGPTLAIRPGGQGDITQSHVAWQANKGSPFVPSPVLYQGRLYMVNDMAGVASCYAASDGRLIWQGRLCAAAKEGFTASPVAVGGRVYFTNDQGETYVVMAEAAGAETFVISHVNRLGERVLASPALAGGRWYIRGERHLYCLGHRDARLADPAQPSPTQASPAPAPKAPPELPVGCSLVRCRLLNPAAIPSPEAIKPYTRALVADVVEVTETLNGVRVPRRVLVARWAIVESRVVPPAVPLRGWRTHRLTLEKFENRADLAREKLLIDTDEIDLPLYFAR